MNQNATALIMRKHPLARKDTLASLSILIGLVAGIPIWPVGDVLGYPGEWIWIIIVSLCPSLVSLWAIRVLDRGRLTLCRRCRRELKELEQPVCPFCGERI